MNGKSKLFTPKQSYINPPLSFSDQLQLLVRRGLSVPDAARAEYYLSHLNYYRFAAYCLPFEKNHATH